MIRDDAGQKDKKIRQAKEIMKASKAFEDRVQNHLNSLEYGSGVVPPSRLEGG